MDAMACVILTAVGCYFSFGLGPAWWLAWLAPVPVLWLVFGVTKPWQGFLAAWMAFALGLTNCMLVWWSGRLFAGIVVHMLFNALALTVLIVRNG